MFRRLIVIHVVFWTIVRMLGLRSGSESRFPGAPRGWERPAARPRFIPPALGTVLRELDLPEALAARLSLLAYPDLPALDLALERVPSDTLNERIGAAYGLLDALSGVPNIQLRAVLRHAFGPAWDVLTIWHEVRYEAINARIAVARAQLEV